jgi:hypothetical protein
MPLLGYHCGYPSRRTQPDWACMIAGPWRFGLGLLMGYPLTSDRRTRINGCKIQFG